MIPGSLERALGQQEQEQLTAFLSRDRDISEVVRTTLTEAVKGGSSARTWSAGGGFGLLAALALRRASVPPLMSTCVVRYADFSRLLHHRAFRRCLADCSRAF